MLIVPETELVVGAAPELVAGAAPELVVDTAPELVAGAAPELVELVFDEPPQPATTAASVTAAQIAAA
jgi:hypothetical protein